MPTILGLAGSLRKGSFNAMLLRAAAEMAPAGAVIEIGSIDGIPLYHGDVEEQDGVPAVVENFKNRIAASDGLLLVTPEYNNSIPGVFKNAIDWASRPPADIARIFRNRPVGLIGATPGLGGTIMAQAAWLPVLRVLGTAPWFGGRVIVSRAREVFDAEGRLTDESIRKQLQTYVTGFVQFVTDHRRG